MFKDSMGRWLTKALFYEANNYQIDNALFTIGDEDITVKGRTLISLRKRFVESNDPTGYTTAIEFLGGYAHWENLLKSSIKIEIEKWQNELDIKLRSIGLRNTICLAKKGNFNAARFLAEKGWDKRTTGRPTKAELEGRLKQDAELHLTLDEDFKRMEGLQ